MGLAPQAFTLRQLDLMAEGRSRQLWGIAASQMALLANLHRDPNKSRKFEPRDFDPHVTAKEPPLERVDISVLKQVFCATS